MSDDEMQCIRPISITAIAMTAESRHLPSLSTDGMKSSPPMTSTILSIPTSLPTSATVKCLPGSLPPNPSNPPSSALTISGSRLGPKKSFGDGEGRSAILRRIGRAGFTGRLEPGFGHGGGWDAREVA